MSRCPLAVALVHHPVLDRRGDLVTTAVTNLDLHDIARAARTYGVHRFYVVTPVAEQQLLVERILGHWRQGHGADYNPHRGQALSLIRSVASLEAALEDWGQELGKPALPVLTGANRTEGIASGECRKLNRSHPLMLVFGTGWGLAPELFDQGWTVLEAICGGGDYNHLSVRSAVAIYLDRLLGNKEE